MSSRLDFAPGEFSTAVEVPEKPWGIIAFVEFLLVVLSTYLLLPIYLKFSDTFYGAFYREMAEDDEMSDQEDSNILIHSNSRISCAFQSLFVTIGAYYLWWTGQLNLYEPAQAGNNIVKLILAVHLGHTISEFVNVYIKSDWKQRNYVFFTNYHMWIKLIKVMCFIDALKTENYGLVLAWRLMLELQTFWECPLYFYSTAYCMFGDDIISTTSTFAFMGSLALGALTRIWFWWSFFGFFPALDISFYSSSLLFLNCFLLDGCFFVRVVATQLGE